ncbi:hypothetical protein N7478_013040 [Penicillium angulare]|uniref:uncharacterized protein n=1 Tax=Penicillium angulare TaxID=116970 RepID=UPI002540B1E4|nr:uncharacterized protein N7478_013040 [Penicillium angulare]KAJ5256936.1 hypothetical protein N7478_013040 [Penicillium angulare]
METFTHVNLRINKIKDQELVQALNGQKVPKALGQENTRRCVIRGIRYHPGFGTELRGLLPGFTRALNAREIMSNQIPEMDPKCPEEFPYCIWHPETASEATYRELAQRYPQLKYLVGRACAVAGYPALFQELGLLPECHIAEEARESGHNAIYDSIMECRVKYNAMNDYTRETFTPTEGRLNGDTVVQKYLDIRFTYKWGTYNDYPGIHWAMNQNSFDITEDLRLCDADHDPGKPPFEIKDEEVLPLLYSPLPTDLPTLNKDLLILTAAYYGDIDRYARLMRQVSSSSSEGTCLVRGIYNNTIFAKWCSIQTEQRFQSYQIQAAISARFIMNGDISRITPDTPETNLPYCIWYPSIPERSVLKALFHRQPKMKLSIARACIMADYREIYDLLDVNPDTTLMEVARDSRNPHYTQDMEAKVPSRGCKDLESKYKYQVSPRAAMFEHTASYLQVNVADRPPNSDWDGITYDGHVVNFGVLNLSLSASESMKENIPHHGALDLEQYYAQ